MITVTKTRDRGEEHFEYPPQAYKDPLGALGELVDQLSLSGKTEIPEVSLTRIKLKARAMGCVDWTLFEGIRDEMFQLLLFLYLYLEAAPMGTSNEPAPLNVKAVMPILGAADLMHFVGWPLGTPNRMKLAALQVCGLGYEPNPQIVLEKSPCVQDIVAAAQLCKEDFCRSFPEALALAS